MEINALPKVMNVRGAQIRIDAPILSDAVAIRAACQEALQHVSESMVADVVYFHQDTFADRPGRNKFTDYGGKEAYYSSGMIPYWRGGLLGSFQQAENDSWDVSNMAFTASYAAQIEQGGGISVFPQEWGRDKLDADFEGDGQIYSIRAHPFMESVVQKLDENMEGFGYLDVFGLTFVAHFNRYI